ncbi:MAG: universal stress protein [Aestuariivirgaceae bacterium]
MRSILVPVEDCAAMDAQLAVAALLARRFDSHVDGVAPFKTFDAYSIGNGVVGVPADTLDRFERDQEDSIVKARKKFRDVMHDREIAWEDPLKVTGRATANWLAHRDGGDQAIGQLARLYDVTVLARPVSNEIVPREALLETVLFESGRPILISPPRAPTEIGNNIAIAWNGSTESARAITFAEPFLRRAKDVVILTVEDGMVAGPQGKEVERTLQRSGIAVTTRLVRPEGRSIGEAILSEAKQIDADLLVKGAYTHSRLRQMLFGGATKHILAKANLPVLMNH